MVASGVNGSGHLLPGTINLSLGLDETVHQNGDSTDEQPLVQCHLTAHVLVEATSDQQLCLGDHLHHGAASARGQGEELGHTARTVEGLHGKEVLHPIVPCQALLQSGRIGNTVITRLQIDEDAGDYQNHQIVPHLNADLARPQVEGLLGIGFRHCPLANHWLHRAHDHHQQEEAHSKGHGRRLLLSTFSQRSFFRCHGG
mmetsp:Transcript_138117/g.240119  ORF Transcript_138117/g.240119 Transcript_138117/m.240119 type:complete len:200 (+) Transcript_138117:1692-2291(+)